MPSEESHAKALSLVDQAVKLDNENNLEAGIVFRFFLLSTSSTVGQKIKKSPSQKTREIK